MPSPPKGYVFTPEELREFHGLQRSFWWFVGRRAVVFDVFRWFRPATPRPRILEIGCGTWLTLSGLREQGFAVGLDISEDALRLCRKEAACVLLADGAALPLAAGSVDAVLALDVVEHFEDDEGVLSFFLFPALVAERLVSRVTKPPPRAYFRRLPAAIDRLLAYLLRLEARMLRAIDLPVGGSIVALARKLPEAGS